MDKKQCFKCAGLLPLSEFYPHPRMADGHLNKCKHCTKKDVRGNRAARGEQYREYDRARNHIPHRHADIVRNARKDPVKYRARKAVDNALRRGKLTKKPCDVCGNPKVDAHHEDYNKPLEVRWLCRKHHVLAHYPDSRSA